LKVLYAWFLLEIVSIVSYYQQCIVVSIFAALLNYFKFFENIISAVIYLIILYLTATRVFNSTTGTVTYDATSSGFGPRILSRNSFSFPLKVHNKFLGDIVTITEEEKLIMNFLLIKFAWQD